MNFRNLNYTIVLAALLLSSCAHRTEIPFDRAAAVNIKRVAIVEPAYPDGVAVYLAASVGRSFGLIGALVDAGMRANRESGMKALLYGQNFDGRTEFKTALDADLRKEGYETVVVAVPTARKPGEFLSSYPPTGTPVDAYLDVTINAYGFLAAGISDSAPYRPTVVLKARLVSATDSAHVLMNDTIIVNPLGTPEDAIAVSPPEEYAFEDFDSLMTQPQRTTEALNKAIDQSAETVAKLLR